jgi:signal transduction histidine kinase
VRLSIRQRLTLWYTAAVALLLGILAVSLTVVYDRIALARLETDLRRINDAVATVLRNELIEKGHAHAAAEEALIEVVVPGRHLAIATRDGRILASRWKLEFAPPIEPGMTESIATSYLPSPATAIARALPPVPDGFIVVTGASWDELSRDRANLLRALAIVMPAALVVTALGAWWVAGRALRPARVMAAEAGRFTGDTRGQRLTVDRQDELGQLGTAFNGVVERLETALDVRTRFLADASHELRTPVSISKTAAEVALSREGREGRTEGEYRDALEVIARQQTHLGRIVSDMLTLARSEATGWPIAPAEFYLDELLDEVDRALSGLAADSGVRTHGEWPAELRIRGDEHLLRQMIVNLVENAIRHTPAGGDVRVTVTVPPVSSSAASGDVAIAVEDTGHGIPEADRDRIFERFVRAPEPGSGTGLGLAIARRIARAHGGDVRLVSTGPSGTHFAVTLPRAVVAS